jgi:hypothetical protein
MLSLITMPRHSTLMPAPQYAVLLRIVINHFFTRSQPDKKRSELQYSDVGHLPELSSEASSKKETIYG